MPRYTSSEKKFRMEEVEFYLRNRDSEVRGKYHPDTPQSRRNGLRKYVKNKFKIDETGVFRAIVDIREHGIVKGKAYPKVILDPEEQLDWCHKIHHICDKHLGQTKMIKLLAPEVFWPGKVLDVKNTIKRCVKCRGRAKSGAKSAISKTSKRATPMPEESLQIENLHMPNSIKEEIPQLPEMMLIDQELMVLDRDEFFISSYSPGEFRFLTEDVELYPTLPHLDGNDVKEETVDPSFSGQDGVILFSPEYEDLNNFSIEKMEELDKLIGNKFDL